MFNARGDSFAPWRGWPFPALRASLRQPHSELPIHLASGVEIGSCRSYQMLKGDTL